MTRNNHLVPLLFVLLTPGCANVGSLEGIDEEMGEGDGVDAADAGTDEPADVDQDGTPDSLDNCVGLANDQSDRDGDLIGDPCDCDPDDAGVAAYIEYADPLTADRGLFARASGFAASNWTFEDGGYRQTRLEDDADDVTIYLGNADLRDVYVRATVASTDIASFGDDDLRQLQLLARVSTGNELSAIGCGIEVVEGLAPTQKSSVLQMSGNPDSLASLALDRVDRSLVVEGEELVLEMDVRGGSVTCTVSLDGGLETTTARSQGIAVTSGAVGFHTRETKALFKDIKICNYQDIHAQ